MRGRLVEFLSRNSTPLAVIGIIAISLLAASLIERRYVATDKAAYFFAARLEAPVWQRLPSHETKLTRIGFGSCLRQNRPAPIFKAIVEARPELFLMMGDNVYGDVKSPDLRELYVAYAQLAAHPDFRPAVVSFPFLATWDDHDFGVNDGGADFQHKKASMAMFKAFWGSSGSAQGPSQDGLYYARTFGNPGERIQIIMLDTRSFRSPLAKRTVATPGRGRFFPDPSPEKTMLGPDQWRWLEGELKKPADLRIIVSSIQVLAEGHNFERWGNLPLERQRLFELIARTGANGVVFLSGDRHRATLYRNAEAGPYPFYEATSSSLNAGRSDSRERDSHQIEALYGQVNFGLLEINWRARTFALTIRDLQGKIVRGQAVHLDELRSPVGK